MVVLQKIKATSPACFFSCSKTKTPPFCYHRTPLLSCLRGFGRFFAEQPADTVYFCCLYRPFGEDPLRARCRSQFFIADLCRCPTSRAFVSAVRTRWSFRGCPLPLLHPQHEDHGMARAVWKACRGDDSHLCQQPICSCLRGRIRPQKNTQIRRCRIERYICVYHPSRKSLLPKPAQRSKKAESARGWSWQAMVFLGLRQGWTKYLARSGIIKR